MQYTDSETTTTYTRHEKGGSDLAQKAPQKMADYDETATANQFAAIALSSIFVIAVCRSFAVSPQFLDQSLTPTLLLEDD